MPATVTVPHAIRPGSKRCPGFLRKNVTVRAACTAAPWICPVVPSSPLGTSTARIGLPDALMVLATSAATPSSGRDSPAPNKASTIRSAPGPSPAVSGSTGPLHRCAITAASPLSAPRSPRSATRTSNPRSASSRAATKPSPPLLPGPHSTAILEPAGTIFAVSSATARPAFSISVSDDAPAASASRSANTISAAVKSSPGCMATILKPGAIAARHGRAELNNFCPFRLFFRHHHSIKQMKLLAACP